MSNPIQIREDKIERLFKASECIRRYFSQYT